MRSKPTGQDGGEAVAQQPDTVEHQQREKRNYFLPSSSVKSGFSSTKLEITEERQTETLVSGFTRS